MAKKNSTVDDIIDTSSQGTSLSDVDFQGGIDLINRVDVATGKLRKGQKRKTIVSAAKKNLFEFPVFVSSSVPMNYAEATVSLIEQLYAAYLQMAISISPIVDAERVKAGQQFAGLKTDTNKYLEYVTDDSTDMWFAQEACHNEITTESADYTFDMLSIEDRDAKMILEYNRLDMPGDEFAHFFMEAQGQGNNPSKTVVSVNPTPDIENAIKNTEAAKQQTEVSKQQTEASKNKAQEQKAKENKINKKLKKKELDSRNELDEDLYNGKNTENDLIKEIDDGINSLTIEKAEKLLKGICDAKNEKDKRDAIGKIDEAIGGDIQKFFENSGLSFSEFEKLLTPELSNTVGITSMAQLMQSVQSFELQRLQIEKYKNDLDPDTLRTMKSKLKSEASINKAKAKYAFSMAKYEAHIKEWEAKVADAKKDCEGLPEAEAQANLNKLRYEAEKFDKMIAKVDDEVENNAKILSAQARKLENETTNEYLERENAIREEQLKSLQHQNSKLVHGIDTAKDLTGIASQITNIASMVISTKDKHEIHKHEMERIQLQNEELKKKLEHYDEDRAFDKKMKKQEVLSKSAIKAPEYIDDSKCQKLNTMKPLMMNVQIAVKNKDDTLQPINYVVGVKTHLRVVPSDVLPEVAQYPLQEMNKISRKVKWRAGELKFFKDIVFRIKEKKQTAADSKDPRRKWYRRLYELANMQGDAPAASVVQGQSIFKTFIKDKQGKSPIQNGMMPNCSILMSKNDVDNIKSQTKIDLLKGSTAKKFCGDLFLLSLVVIDTDSEQIKVLLPDMHNDYDVHSLMSVEKQMASLDTAGTKTKEMFKLLG